MNPVDELRTVEELHVVHELARTELAKAERAVEYLTGRIEEIEAALKERAL